MSEVTNTNVDFETFVPAFDSILARGLSKGLGKQDGQVCIEAAVCAALGLPHGDDPHCVATSVRSFKIVLNDSNWSSPEARAKGMRDLGIAQVGSLGVVDDVQFSTLLAEKVIRVLLPKLFREVFPNDAECLAAADRCEKEGTSDYAESAARSAARYAGSAARSAARSAAYTAESAAYAAAYAAGSAARSAARSAAYAAEYAARYAESVAAYAESVARSAAYTARSDLWLSLVADLALEVLFDLNSPGCSFVTRKAEVK